MAWSAASLLRAALMYTGTARFAGPSAETNTAGGSPAHLPSPLQRLYSAAQVSACGPQALAPSSWLTKLCLSSHSGSTGDSHLDEALRHPRSFVIPSMLDLSLIARRKGSRAIIETGVSSPSYVLSRHWQPYGASPDISVSLHCTVWSPR